MKKRPWCYPCLLEQPAIELFFVLNFNILTFFLFGKLIGNHSLPLITISLAWSSDWSTDSWNKINWLRMEKSKISLLLSIANEKNVRVFRSYIKDRKTIK